MGIRRASAAFVLCLLFPTPAARAADAPACAAAKADVAKTEAQIADFKQKLAALEAHLAVLKTDAAKACPAAAVPPALVAGPATKTARLPLPEVAKFLNDALGGTLLRFHTFGGNASFVAPGPRLGGARIPVAVPAPTFQAGAFQATLFVNDVNSNGISVAAAGDKLAVTVTFESAGPELFVRGPVPLDVDADNGRAVLTLTPGLDASGRPSFSTLDADMTATIRCTAPNQILAGICNTVEPFAASFLRTQAAAGLRQTLSTPDFRSRVGAAMRALLDAPAGKAEIEKATGQKIGTIKATRFEAGGVLAIDHD